MNGTPASATDVSTANVSTAEKSPLFLTGLYGTGSAHAAINVYSRDSALSAAPVPLWSWSPATDDTLTGAEWQNLRKSRSVTEVKWADGGKKVVALVGDYVVLVSVPRKADEKPRLLFATALEDASNAHSVEVLPGNRIAVADGGRTVGNAGVQVYAVGDQRLGKGRYEQQVTGFPSTHGLLWDATKHWLWVTGCNVWPDRPGAQGLVRAYAFDAKTKLLHPKHVAEQKVGTGKPTAEAPEEWDGPHDVAGVPGTRHLLITTEQDVHLWDTSDPGHPPVQAPQLKDFVSESAERDKHGHPRSRFKSIGVRAESGEIVYTQPSAWGPGKDYPDMIGFAKGPGNKVLRPHRTAYKARWFEATPGWETPPVVTPHQ
ncbi:hypothetical protein [Streptomyces sp. UNOC14_S4]|uniref:hypothetical protein n=1 Tax=Streptomyces sp. UNOC14_S4 TaxID=2872340 RepID=UPI001E5B820D|nr:hypothetical protein [Streptomyces sp. UNOC14_S4]MCC3767841.1 hypothetical protein [Streptomyces sp. UNOC14_S4]